MSNVAAAMIEAEARDSIKKAETLEDKFKAAFSVARNHWMFTDEDEQFRGAISAVIYNLDSEGDDYKRVECELGNLRNLNAMFSGVPVDIENMLDESYEPIGITKLWRDDQ